MTYTAAQVAELLKTHVQSVQSLCRSGAIRAVNISPKKQRATWRVTQEALDEFLNPHRDTKTAKKATRQTRIDAGVQRVYE